MSYFVKEKSIRNLSSDWKYFYEIMSTFSYVDNLKAEEILNNIKETFSHCFLPGDIGKSSIQVAGKVQSGKTTNFLGLTAASIDLEYDLAIILGGTKISLLEQNILRAKESFSDENVIILNTSSIKNLNPVFIEKSLKKGKKIVIIIMKESSHLKSLVELIEGSSISNKSVIIVDDESDIASIDNKNGRKQINHLLGNIHNMFRCSNYIGYSATIWASLCAPKSSWHAPDFINLIYPPSEYCGLNTFHKDSNSEYYGLKDALLDFLVRAALLKKKGYFDNNKDDIEMIIHIDRVITGHEEILDQVRGTLNGLIKNYSEDNIVNSIFYKESNGLIIDSALRKSFNTILMNGLEIKRLYDKDNTKLKSEHANVVIYIGGDMLGRGVTFKPLVTLLYRESKVTFMDTLLQRARWFGYRKNQILFDNTSMFDLMKVYLTDVNSEFYYEIRRSDEALWNVLEFIKSNSIDLNIVTVPLLSGIKDLLPTSQEKLSEYKKPVVFTRNLTFDFDVIFSSPTNLEKIDNIAKRLIDKAPIQALVNMISIAYYLNQKYFMVFEGKKVSIELKMEGEIYFYGDY
jgi:hypothetical protein